MPVDGEFTEWDLERLDLVDNAVAELISQLIPQDCDFDWDIELIGIVIDALEEVIVDRLGVMTAQEFYPYIEVEI